MIEMRRVMARLKNEFVVTSYFKVLKRRLVGSDTWHRLTLVNKHLNAIDRNLVQVVRSEHRAVVANSLNTLITIVKLLN